MRPIPPWAAYSAFGVGVAALSGAVVYALLPSTPALCRGWSDPAVPDQIRELTKPIENLTNLDGLGDFFAGVAWIESRGDPRAGSDTGNAARGLLGMRPKSARVADLGLSPSALKDMRTSLALGTWYIHRCIPYADPGQKIDWLALRRCWGYPSDVDDVDSSGYRDQFARGLRCSGVDPDFMNKTAIRWNYHWPGIDAILNAVGRPRA